MSGIKRFDFENIGVWVVAFVSVVGFVLFLIYLSSTNDERQERAQIRQEQQIQLGQECASAGGQWVHNGWSGFLCEFRDSEVTS